MKGQTRRDFLKQSVVAGAMLSSGVGLCARPGMPGAKMKLGLVTYQWGRDWNLPTLISNCEKTGYAGVELRTTHAHGVEPSLNASQRRDVKKRFADTPVVFIGPGSNEQYDYPDPFRLVQSVEATRALIKLSYDCGGTGVKVKPNSLHKGVDPKKTIEQIGKTLNLLGSFAADHGQKIRVEVHGGCSPLPIMKQIFDYIDHPNVGMCWNCNGEDLNGRGLEYNFNLVKNRFGQTVHVRELNIGSYPYQKLMDMFVRMDYKGWILLEARTKPKDRIAALIEQREVFKKMIASAQTKL